MTNGTVKPTLGHEPKVDAERLRKAIKGLGTDEKELIAVIGSRTSFELKHVVLEYKIHFERDLLEDIKSDTSGNFREVLIGRLLTRAEYDAQVLYNTLASVNTDEDVLIEILATRSNSELRAIREEYKKLTRTDLETAIMRETSGDFRIFMTNLAQANRDENFIVSVAAAAADAQVLFEGGEERHGTNESRFLELLSAQSFDQIRLLNEEFKKLSVRDLVAVIDAGSTGSLKKAMLAVAKSSINRADFFAEKLYNAMHGLGTDDRTVVRIVVSRCEVDMVEIKEAFLKRYGKSLNRFLEDDLSGSYKKLVVQLVGSS